MRTLRTAANAPIIRNRAPTWTPSLSEGNVEIDEQHKKLLLLAQQVVQLIDALLSANAQQLHGLMNDIVDLAWKTVATEEKLLARVDFPDLAGHKAEHDIYLERLTEILCHTSQRDVDEVALAQILTEYTNHHLLDTDQQSKEFLKNGAK